MATKHKKEKKVLLKKIVKSKRKGASPFKMDNGLGKTPLDPGSGNGSNLGLNGIF